MLLRHRIQNVVGAALIAATAVAVVAPATPAQAALQTGQLQSSLGVPSPRGGWTICLDVPGGDDDAGTSVRLYPLCNGTAAQRFTLDTAPGAVTDVSVLGKCLDVQGGATNNGARVQIWHCNGTPAQKWQAVANPGWAEGGMLRNPVSGRCLIANGDGAVITDCVGGRQFSFIFAAQIF